MKTKNELVIAFCHDKKQLIKSFETGNINPEYVEWLEQKLLSQLLTPISEEEIRELAKKFLSLRILSKGARIEDGKVIHSTIDGENNANHEINRISEFIVNFQSYLLSQQPTQMEECKHVWVVDGSVSVSTQKCCKCGMLSNIHL